MKVDPDNRVYYKYYEKPKMQCLSNNLIRRLLNTVEDLSLHYRADMVNSYGVKLLTSGYSYDQGRRILVNRANGYLSKVKRRRENGGIIHRTAEESSSSSGGSLGRAHGTVTRDRSKIQTPFRWDLFLCVPRKSLECSGSMLPVLPTFFNSVREQLKHLGATLGDRIRVVEMSGRNILTNFLQLQTWKGLQCGRDECVTCNQGGEELPNCALLSVMYESICSKCNPGALRKGELKSRAEGAPSLCLYLGVGVF